MNEYDGRNRHNPYVCYACGDKIPEGEPYDVAGLSTVCLDCSEGGSR